MPPPAYNPLAPTVDPDHPTELPAGEYDVAVFDNLFPTLTAFAHDPPSLEVATRPGRGACEVVVFTQQSETSLGALPLWHIELIVEVWGDRYRELGARDDVAYVYPFENRGVEVGVTLPAPARADLRLSLRAADSRARLAPRALVLRRHRGDAARANGCR